MSFCNSHPGRRSIFYVLWRTQLPFLLWNKLNILSRNMYSFLLLSSSVILAVSIFRTRQSYVRLEGIQHPGSWACGIWSLCVPPLTHQKSRIHTKFEQSTHPMRILPYFLAMESLSRLCVQSWMRILRGYVGFKWGEFHDWCDNHSGCSTWWSPLTSQ